MNLERETGSTSRYGSSRIHGYVKKNHEDTKITKKKIGGFEYPVGLSINFFFVFPIVILVVSIY